MILKSILKLFGFLLSNKYKITILNSCNQRGIMNDLVYPAIVYKFDRIVHLC